ncbi:MAG: hypothetical protein COB36_00770 [Alphaproteobacteria bacterium]|nr:MAG: hypothetical protein COB36_00770 [Alphaproteobacteria bacterium]
MTLCKQTVSFLSLFGVLIVAGCGYVSESSHQNITFLTPDAQDAKCFAFVDGIKYQVFPPQTLNIKKSEKDMLITCHAPGNRTIKMEVPADLTTRAIWGGPVGMAWDYASDSLYHYPSVIAIDFSHVELKPNKLPQHNNSDIKQPESYDLEEFKSSQPRLNSDKFKIEQPILHRGEEISEPSVSEDMSASDVMPVEGEDDDSLQSVLDGLVDGDVSVTSEEVLSEEALSEPVSIYPGQ